MFLVVLSFLWTSARGDTEVACVFMERCILPCSYENGTDLVIHWQQISAGKPNVHSFFYKEDQHESQNQHFRGRTSLFKDQISTGNASLQLAQVTFQDEGRYLCYTSTMSGYNESFMNLKIVISGIKISCVFMESCILPCSHENYIDRIFWHQWSRSERLSVHSYYSHQDQLRDQDQHFRGRTSLFKDYISTGNASLQLTGVKLHDQGIYICHTFNNRGNKKSCVELKINEMRAEEATETHKNRRVLATDTAVSCVFMERCILPCSYKDGTDLVIHWQQVSAGEISVYSYYYKEDQLKDQDQRFRSRTSLFKDQLSRGNASLQLTRVEVQDQGRYMCYTATNSGTKESFINLMIDAPVHEVNIQQVGNMLTCSSQGIYPKPELTWSTRPPSNVNLKNGPIEQQTEQKLYNISSSLILPVSVTDLDYICTVSTRRNGKRAILKKLDGSGTETTIFCMTSNTSLSSFLWKFNHSEIVVVKNRTDVAYTVSKEWMQHVKHVSESGSLTLQDLTSNQEGMYTCEFSYDKEMLKTETSVKIEQSQGYSASVGVLIGRMIAAVLLAAAAGAVFLVVNSKKRKGSTGSSNGENSLKQHESIPLQDKETQPHSGHTVES